MENIIDGTIYRDIYLKSQDELSHEEKIELVKENEHTTFITGGDKPLLETIRKMLYC